MRNVTTRKVLIRAVMLFSFPLSAFSFPGGFSESPSVTVDTSIERIDMDNDGMIDPWETANGLNVGLDDSGLDPDGDGYTNIREYNAGQNPQVAEPHWLPSSIASFTLHTRQQVIDGDSDGMPDAWETAHGLNPGVHDAGLDPDGDGLTNIEEYNSGTDPQVDDWAGPSVAVSVNVLIDTGGYPFDMVADSDSDGMPDWWEYKYGLNMSSNDASADPDGDTVSNLDEFLTGMLPNSNDTWGIVIAFSPLWTLDGIGLPPDTDGDGMRDWWEILFGLNINIDDSALDPDGDGRTNFDEYNAGTNPQVDDWAGPSRMASAGFSVDTGGFNGGYAPDGDSDGMPDWWETFYGLNPIVNDAAANPDGDALTNIEEYNAGTNPSLFDWLESGPGFGNLFVLDTGGKFVDFDGDGMPDWWERKFFGDITNALSVLDADGDRLSNYGEYVAGTDPGDDLSTFTIAEYYVLSPVPDEFVIKWDTVPERIYMVFASTNLLSPWPTTAVYQTAGDGTQKVYTNSNPAERFFRLGVELE